MKTSLLRQLILPVLVGLLAVLVAATWAPFVARPSIYLAAAAIGVLLIALCGATLRPLGARVPIILLAQLVVAVGWLQWRFEDLGPLWRSVRAGARAVNTTEAPVPVEYAGTAPFLAACALTLALTLDLIAAGAKRTAMAGLPLLLALTIPISTLDRRIPLPLLLGVLAVFAILLALEHRWQADAWGRVVGTVRRGPIVALVAGLAIGAAVLGLTAAAILPTGEGIDLNRGDGEGRGEISVSNPLVEIRRGLVNQSHLEMMQATAPRRTPRYLRLAVLDEYDDGQWKPSSRDLPEENRVSAGIPQAPGLYASVPGNTETFGLRYSEAFSSRWLATPYPYLSVDLASGDYRFDERTLDLFNVDRNDEASARAGYEVEAFIPSFSAEDLDGAGSAPAGIDEEMTALPKGMPAQVASIAADVIGEKRTDYQRVVALQDWFRNSGGFRYSLWDGPPTKGSEALVGFLTTDKVGYCEQFATAMAVMARTIGVPARVAVGFGRPESSPRPGTYVFTGKSLHAWTEIYFEGYGWVVFDPTPAVQSGPAPNYSEGIEQAPQPRATDSEAPSAQPSPTRPDRAPDPSGQDASDEGSPTWPWLVLGLLGIAAVTPRVLRRRQRRQRLDVLHDEEATATERADAAWRELRATTLDHRLEWPEAKSPRNTLTGLQRQLDLDRSGHDRVGRLATLAEQARYARSAEFSPPQREGLGEDTEFLLAEITRAVTPADRRRARWWPASWWRRD